MIFHKSILAVARGPRPATAIVSRGGLARNAVWELEKGGRERQIAVTGALFENDPRIAELAVLTGEVISFAFEAQVAPHLASGALESVLDDWCPSFPGFHLYYPSRRQVTPALRAFIEAMKGDSRDVASAAQSQAGRRR